MNQTFYVCTICRMILKTPFNLRQHKQTHKMREGHTFYCARCKKVFTSCKYLQRHKELNRCEEKVACSVCKILVNSIRIEDHVLKHYLPDLYKCDFCSKKFNHKCDIKVHIERSHPNGQLICEMCKFKCKDFNKMMKHEKLHIGENLCGCPKCQFQTRSMGKLLKHMQKWKHTNASNWKLQHKLQKTTQLIAILQLMSVRLLWSMHVSFKTKTSLCECATEIADNNNKTDEKLFRR